MRKFAGIFVTLKIVARFSDCCGVRNSGCKKMPVASFTRNAISASVKVDPSVSPSAPPGIWAVGMLAATTS